MSVFETIVLQEEIIFAVSRAAGEAFDPFRFTGVPGWRVGWQDHLSLALQRGVVHRRALAFERMLIQGSVAISNQEQHTRLRHSRHILLDAKVFEVFYTKEGLFDQLCSLIPGYNGDDVYFNGTEIISPEGEVHIACLYKENRHTRYKFERLSHVARSNICSAVIMDHPFK